MSLLACCYAECKHLACSNAVPRYNLTELVVYRRLGSQFYLYSAHSQKKFCHVMVVYFLDANAQMLTSSQQNRNLYGNVASIK